MRLCCFALQVLGETPAMVATRRGHAEVAGLLIGGRMDVWPRCDPVVEGTDFEI